MTTQLEQGVAASIFCDGSQAGRELRPVVVVEDGDRLRLLLDREAPRQQLEAVLLIVGGPRSRSLARAQLLQIEGRNAEFLLLSPWAPDEQRKSRRVPTSVPASLRASGFQVTGTITNISMSGVEFRSPGTSTPERLEIEIESAGLTGTFPCERVAQERSGRSAVTHLEFLWLAPGQVAFLSHVLQLCDSEARAA